MMTGRLVNRGTLAMGLGGLLCLSCALLLLRAGVGAAGADEARAAAKPCAAGAAWDADCLQNVIGTVAGVTQQRSGKSVDYTLQAWTSHGYVDADFLGSNRLVRQARGGDELILTEWRGKVVAVSGYGLREGATAVATDRTRSELAGASFLAGLAMILLPGAVATAVKRGNRPLLRGVPQFALLASLLFGVVLIANALLVAAIDPRVDLGVVAGFFAAALASCLMLVRFSSGAATPVRSPNVRRGVK